MRLEISMLSMVLVGCRRTTGACWGIHVSICTQFSQSTLISWIRRTIDNVVDRRKTALLQELKSLVESTDTDERAAKAATKECMDELHLNWFDRVRL